MCNPTSVQWVYSYHPMALCMVLNDFNSRLANRKTGDPVVFEHQLQPSLLTFVAKEPQIISRSNAMRSLRWNFLIAEPRV